MKRKILVTAFSVTLAICAISLASCGSSETSDKNIEHDASHDGHAEYMCPMDCEHGKKYDEAGSCPVCKMDLEEVKNDE